MDFKKIRLESLLIKFAKSNEIPNEFIDGTLNLEDAYALYKKELSEYHLKLLNKIRRILASRLRKSQEGVLQQFMEEYLHFYNNQCTKEEKWHYDIVMSKYRANLNPIRALYYELLNIMNSYNPESTVHVFVLNLFMDAEWCNTIINCVTKDVKAIDNITSTYHYPLEKIGEKPFEFFYLLKLKKDLVTARSVFRSMEHWTPDE